MKYIRAFIILIISWQATIAATQSTQACQAILLELGTTISQHKEQHSDSIIQMEAAIKKLESMLDAQELQNQETENIINQLRTQLFIITQQKDQEISILQAQLKEAAQERIVIKNEYDAFIDMCIAYGQNLYTMLQQIKKEYAGLMADRDQFFTALELFTNKCSAQTEDMVTELSDILS